MVGQIDVSKVGICQLVPGEKDRHLESEVSSYSAIVIQMSLKLWIMYSKIAFHFRPICMQSERILRSTDRLQLARVVCSRYTIWNKLKWRLGSIAVEA